jgi:hypothetical protein
LKILLLTDIPPCKNYTAGLVLDQLLGFISTKEYVICSVMNPNLAPKIPDKYSEVPHLKLKKPREAALRIGPGILGAPFAFIFEIIQAFKIKIFITRKIISFIREQNVQVIWVVLQGQTMVRLADNLMQSTKLPVITQVWDAFDWWLRENRIDRFTKVRLLATFDKVIKSSKSCATASWAMSNEYTKNFGIPNIPVIAGLPEEFFVSNVRRDDLYKDNFIIGIAGQFYAQDAWNRLLEALDSIDWTLQKRKIIIRIMGSRFSMTCSKPGNFEYLGWRSQEDTIQILSTCDLLYLPYWFDPDRKSVV